MWERSTDQLPLVPTPARDQTHHSGMSLTRNWTSALSLCRMTPNQLSHTSQGRSMCFYNLLNVRFIGLKLLYCYIFLMDWPFCHFEILLFVSNINFTIFCVILTWIPCIFLHDNIYICTHTHIYIYVSIILLSPYLCLWIWNVSSIQSIYFHHV